jgi:hypothetical protein
LKIPEHSLPEIALGQLRDRKMQKKIIERNIELNKKDADKKENLMGKQPEKWQMTGRCGDLLTQTAPCVIGTDRYRKRFLQTDANTQSNFHRQNSQTYSICCSQIDAQASSSGTQQKHKYIRARLKISHHVTSFRNFGRSVQPHVCMFTIPHVFLKQKECRLY